MIIGISGKIKSGKDTVGEYIQQKLTNQDFQIKKFADKLKDVTCLLLGCTREQLEDREFKEKELGEEWDLYELDWSDGWGSRMSIVTKDFNKKDFLDKKGVFVGELGRKIQLTPRKVLQLLGTEAGRGVIHPQIWINALMSGYKVICRLHIGLDFGGVDVYPNWIVTDMRFPNELEAVKNKKGITIRINRPETDHLAGDHSSETALDNSEFDYVIDNTGTVEDLERKIDEILIKIGLV